MKKAFLTLALAVGMLMANAQTAKKFNTMSDEALTSINATEEQKKQVADLAKEHREKVAALRKNTALNDEQKKEEMKKINAYRNERFWNEILTPEQSKALKAKQKEAKIAESKQ